MHETILDACLVYLQGCDSGYAITLSTLQQEAWAFIDSLMAQPISHRPSAEQALHHSFLATASLECGEKELRLLLPNYSQDRDLLPIVPWDKSCLEEPVSLSSLPETALVSSSWAITAFHGTLPLQPESSSSGRVSDLTKPKAD